MNYVYTVAGKPVTLEAADNVVAVRFREPAPHSERARFASSARLNFDKRVEVPNEKYTLLTLRKEAGIADQPSALSVHQEAAHPLSGVSRSAPVFRVGSTSVFASDRVIVGLKDLAEPVELVLSGVPHAEVRSRGNGEYLVRLPESSDPLAVAHTLAAHPSVRYAEPDFVNVGYRVASPQQPPAPAPALPGQLIQHQYAMRLTRAQDAWGLVKGDPKVRIAILDEGVDSKHKDLAAHIVGAYDAMDGDSFQEPNAWDGHGTACAGLAAAVPAGDGVRGVGGGCSILAVRIAESGQPHGPWIWSNDRAGAAIEWAWRQGADVLSNSWGGGAPSNRIAEAFARARTQGRGGKGCVVVVAAGNDAHEVTFPGTLPGILTVSASNEKDEFKTKTSSDGETFWGSNFGPEVGIAAPGVHNLTTDITGAGGYDSSGYFATFNGTSSATPLVAGAAALVLSAKPGLTGSQVQDLMKRTADKVGALPYTQGRSDQFGHGRLNVLAAIQAAQAA